MLLIFKGKVEATTKTSSGIPSKSFNFAIIFTNTSLPNFVAPDHSPYPAHTKWKEYMLSISAPEGGHVTALPADTCTNICSERCLYNVNDKKELTHILININPRIFHTGKIIICWFGRRGRHFLKKYNYNVFNRTDILFYI